MGAGRDTTIGGLTMIMDAPAVTIGIGPSRGVGRIGSGMTMTAGMTTAGAGMSFYAMIAGAMGSILLPRSSASCSEAADSARPSAISNRAS
ncbi:hypothetical protein D9599_26890 [Roseomonas sp. KE2513]|nr:hypothetical protein [Roseomonas sp. KE2513]